jgi:hypothetical protein
VHLNKSAKKLLPIITKQNRDDGEVLVKEISQTQLIPWRCLNEMKVFLDSHTVSFPLETQQYFCVIVSSSIIRFVVVASCPYFV